VTTAASAAAKEDDVRGAIDSPCPGASIQRREARLDERFDEEIHCAAAPPS